MTNLQAPVRDSRPYSEPRDCRGVDFRPPINGKDGADVPVAGFYEGKLRGGAAPCGLRIWFGPPYDPMTGEKMDRSYRWQAHVNGTYIEIEEIWPFAIKSKITEKRYDQFCLRQNWAKQNAPQSALADPRQQSNSLNSPLYF